MPIRYEALKEHLKSVLGEPTTPNLNQTPDCSKSATTKDWVRQSQVDGEWNNSLLQVTKNMVQDGCQRRRNNLPLGRRKSRPLCAAPWGVMPSNSKHVLRLVGRQANKVMF